METITKVCTCCNVEQPIDCFYKKPPAKKRTQTGHGRKAMCKDCYKRKATEWAQKNREKRLAIARRSAEKNREARKAYYDSDRAKELAAKWRRANAVDYMRRRRAADPVYAFTVKIRVMLMKALRKKGYTKRSKSQQIIGCTWGELVAHIESKFQPGMTWENRGEWHIDHITPLATAETEADIIRLNHYTNLQPLWAADNLRKGDRVLAAPDQQDGR